MQRQRYQNLARWKKAMYVIGLDIGTTGTKALLMDAGGTVLGKGYQGYALRAQAI